MIQERPKIKIELRPWDKMLEASGWMLLLAFWLYTFANYPQLPDTIPTHFNALGEADGFGDKSSIYILPVVASIFFFILTVLNRFPYIFNYLVTITEANALKQYTMATRFMRYLKLALVFIFFLIGLKTIQTASNTSNSLGIWLLPFTAGIIFIPLIVFIIRSFKAKNSLNE